MFDSVYLLLSLLLNFVQMVSTTATPSCDVAKKPDLGSVNVSRYSGVWYQRVITTSIPREENVTAFVANITACQYDGKTILHLVIKKSHIGGLLNCTFEYQECVLNGSTCKGIGTRQMFDIIVNDYDGTSAVWTQPIIDGKRYDILGLYTRDAFSQPNTSSIQSQLQQFCGAEALDPNSSFYGKKDYYDNNPCFA